MSNLTTKKNNQPNDDFKSLRNEVFCSPNGRNNRISIPALAFMSGIPRETVRNWFQTLRSSGHSALTDDLKTSLQGTLSDVEFLEALGTGGSNAAGGLATKIAGKFILWVTKTPSKCNLIAEETLEKLTVESLDELVRRVTEFDKPKQISEAEKILLLEPYARFAVANPGIDQMVQRSKVIPCLIIHNKPFKLRYWVDLHHPSLDVSRSSLTRLGREIASVYRQHKLILPMHSYTQSTNQYNKFDHDLICQVFNTMFEAGTL